MLVKRPHAPIENRVQTREVIWIRIEPSGDVLLLDRNGTPVMPCLDDFQRRIVGDAAKV